VGLNSYAPYNESEKGQPLGFVQQGEMS
jgi:hypothetical protein